MGKGKGGLLIASIVLILALVLWGCGKPKGTAMERAERLLLKGDAASLQEAKSALQEAVTADPKTPRPHELWGKVYLKETMSEKGRDKLEELYNSATVELEKALELHGEAGAPVELYQQLIDVCRERAALPKRFNAERDSRLGVGPWEVKAMEKAIKAFDLGRARFPQNPAFSPEKGKALQDELAALKVLYAENVQRAWLSRPSGFVSPDKQKQVQ